MRDAAARWERIEASDGIEGRDRLWEHPDLLPTSDDFSAPAAVTSDEPGLTEADFDALLASDGSGGPTERLGGGVSKPKPGADDDRDDGPTPSGA